MKLSSYCSHDLKMTIFYQGHVRLFSSPGQSPEELMHYPQRKCCSLFKGLYFPNDLMDLVRICIITDIGPIYPAMAYRSHRVNKTRSLGQILEKTWVGFRRHSFDPIFKKLSEW